MSARITAATLLERALIADANRAGTSASISAANAKSWASATFVGARHRVTIEGVHSPALGAWLNQLPEADLPVRGHLVADLAVVDQSYADGHFSATIEVLTVEEA